MAHTPIELFTAIDASPLPELRDLVRRFDAIGVDGVFVTDHYFWPSDRPRSEMAKPGFEPLTYLATIGTMSNRLKLGTTVMNSAWIHPAHLVRSFAQLAVLFGGERVVAGLGAGWHREEFEALALSMPPLRERWERLEAACALSRDLFDRGVATTPGLADELPLSPRPEIPPRLLVGGGSERMLDIAGRYADIIDLASPPALAAGASVHSSPWVDLIVTVEDLERSVHRIAAAAQEAGRPAPTVSLGVEWWRFCTPSEVADVEADICRRHRIEARDLQHSPFIFVGDASRIRDLLAERRERLGIGLLTVPEDVVERLRADVLTD
jgi:alkanesulfonate monooxygenase SsuD/methylene tetrahydromethanopterin reductase-like flavin-dependent oxidoreductase (luciferase family)